MDLFSLADGAVSTLLGGVLGGVLRLAPEVLKLVDRGNERKHELAMLDKNTEAEKARAATGVREQELKSDTAQAIGALEALKEALKGQFQPTGAAWVDALNASVRPVLTYGIVAPYVVGKLLVFLALVWTGGLAPAAVSVALSATYAPTDMGILAGILNFWFLGRVFDKR